MTAQGDSFVRFGRLDRLELHHGRYTDFGFPKHSHDEYVIGLNYSGLEHVWLDGKTFEVPPGLITVYNPGEVQSSGCDAPEGWEFKSLYVDIETVRWALGEQAAPHSHWVLEQPLIDDPELLELVDLAAVERPMARVMNPRRELVDYQGAAGQLEQLHADHAHIVQRPEGRARDGLGLS